VIKTVLALQNKQIPPSINFDAPNPRIDFKNSPFFVNTELRVWKTDGFPRRAGISSFGIGGTNAHVVVEEAPELPESGPSREWQLLPISARTPAALEDATDNIVEFLLSHPNLNLADVAYTLKVGRKAFDNRRFVVVRDLQHGADYFKTREPAYVFTELKDKSAPQHSPPLVFMFPGQGAQYVNMTRELYETEPIFREQVDLCFQLLEPHLGQDIRDLIFPLDDSEETLEVSADKIKQTVITQPALFVIEYSLAQLFIEWGIHPKAMIGHSIGEFVAACLAGVFSLDDAIAIVAERGRLMQSLPGGSMISLPMKEAEAHNLIAQLEVECPNLSLAVVNAPELCAVSGPDDEIDTLIRSLEDQEVEYRRLHTSHAFHSPMMEPILTSFAQYVEQVELAEPEIPFISNVTGTWITPEEATDPHYWALHLRNTVRFSKGIETLYEDPSWIFIEIGPGRTLSTLTRAVMTAISSESLAQAAGQGNVIQTVRHPRTQGPDDAFLLNAMGRLWLAGVNINWEAYYINGYRKRIPLPTYPFQRQRYWIEPDQSLSQYISSKNKAGDLIKRSDLNEWFYLPSWKRLNLISDSSTNTVIASHQKRKAGLL
jgi:acyl transferase domain-containing protein